jgi:hypothetical protein
MANVLTQYDLINSGNVYPAGLKYNVLAGAAANTNIAVAGIVPTDKIIFCIQIVATSANVVDLTSEVVILSNGNIQLTTTVSTGNKLILCWYDVN